jgi:hypothetical protein
VALCGEEVNERVEGRALKWQITLLFKARQLKYFVLSRIGKRPAGDSKLTGPANFHDRYGIEFLGGSLPSRHCLDRRFFQVSPSAKVRSWSGRGI